MKPLHKNVLVKFRFSFRRVQSLNSYRLWFGKVQITDFDFARYRFCFVLFRFAKFNKSAYPYKGMIICCTWQLITNRLKVTDSKYRESLDRFEKTKTLKLCLKNAFRELSSRILFCFSKNLTSSRNSQETKIYLFTLLNMQKISGKLTKFSVFDWNNLKF